MSSLAHEGNPKEDQITIGAGDVLSTAQLDLDFLFFGSVDSPNMPSAIDTAPYNVSSSCPNVFTWNTARYIPFFYNTNQASSGTNTIWTDQFPFSATNKSAWLNVTIENKPFCCGCAYVPVSMQNVFNFNLVNAGSPSVPDLRPQGVFPCHDITVGVTVQAILDKPYAGICCFVEDGSTAEDFTGYVLAANYEIGVTKLMKYEHQSLCTEGTVLGVINAVPTAGNGDGLKIQVFTDPTQASTSNIVWEIIGFLFNEGSSIDLQQHDNLMDVIYTAINLNAPGNSTSLIGARHNRANVGLVAIGNHNFGSKTPGNIGTIFLGGSLTVGADINNFGIKSECNSLALSFHEAV